MTWILSLAISVSVALAPAQANEPPTYEAAQNDYSQFLLKLQKALRQNDRAAVIDAVKLPLRVNRGEGSVQYRSKDEIVANFDVIFNKATIAAILEQSPQSIFSRDIGAMVGDGEIWFTHTCLDDDCSEVGPVQIYAINHF